MHRISESDFGRLEFDDIPANFTSVRSERGTIMISSWEQQGQISCSTNQRICLHFRSQLIIMPETRNLHQGEIENIAVFSGFREIQF
jgi:hypothetical protein